MNYLIKLTICSIKYTNVLQINFMPFRLDRNSNLINTESFDKDCSTNLGQKFINVFTGEKI